MKNKCKIKWVGALRGRSRVDCEKKSAKLRGLGIKGRIAKKRAKLRGLQH